MAQSRRTASADELADSYGELRTRCLELGRSITPEQAAIMTPCCPAWSVKDVFAHMAGVADDIMSGNVEGAATEPWADAQVTARAEHSLVQICNELEDMGRQVEDAVRAAPEMFPPQFFLDAWTHEWDIRQAVGAGAAATPDLRLLGAAREWLTRALDKKAKGVGAAAFELTVVGNDESWIDIIGDGVPTEKVEMSLFELGRVTMGRRSAEQVEALRPSADPSLMVFWSLNDQFIVDPLG